MSLCYLKIGTCHSSIVLLSTALQRKSGSDPPENPSKKKRDVVSKTILKDEIPPINPVLAGIYSRSSDFQRKPLPARTVSGRTIVLAPEMEPAVSGATTSGAPLSTHQALARQAVGRGIRHELGRPKEVPSSIKQPTFPTATGSLTELASNYHSSLFSTTANDVGECNDNDPTPLSQMEDRPGLFSEVYSGFLSRNSSLVDLAMIAPVDDGPEPMQSNHEFGFVDFPNPEDHQSNQNGF